MLAVGFFETVMSCYGDWFHFLRWSTIGGFPDGFLHCACKGIMPCPGMRMSNKNSVSTWKLLSGDVMVSPRNIVDGQSIFQSRFWSGILVLHSAKPGGRIARVYYSMRLNAGGVCAQSWLRDVLFAHKMAAEWSVSRILRSTKYAQYLPGKGRCERKRACMLNGYGDGATFCLSGTLWRLLYNRVSHTACCPGMRGCCRRTKWEV